MIDRVLEDQELDIIFDDDGAGEIADVVAIRIGEDLVSVTLWHCKYSSTHTPGARVKDLYEVCGQARESARWRDRPNRMLAHMLSREKRRRGRGQPSRLERGMAAQLRSLRRAGRNTATSSTSVSFSLAYPSGQLVRRSCTVWPVRKRTLLIPGVWRSA